MISTKLALSLVVLVALWGCTSLESPEVARRCAPARGLLSTKIDIGSNVDFFVGGGGFHYKTDGPKLSGTDTKEVFDTDELCRAWVHGALDDNEYADLLKKLVAARWIEAERSLERDGEQVSKAALDDFLAQIEAKFGELAIAKGTSTIAGLDKVEQTDSLRGLIDEWKRRPDLDVRETTFMTAVDLHVLAKKRETKGLTMLEVPTALIERINLIDMKLDRVLEREFGGRPGVCRHSVLFDTGADQLTWGEVERLTRIVDAWPRSAKISIIGYADRRGRADENRSLALRRAASVVAVLKDLGKDVGPPVGVGATDEFGTMERNRRTVVSASACASR